MPTEYQLMLAIGCCGNLIEIDGLSTLPMSHSAIAQRHLCREQLNYQSMPLWPDAAEAVKSFPNQCFDGE